VSAAVPAVTRHLPVQEVLQVIVRSAARLLDVRYAALGVPDDEGSFGEFVVEGVSEEEWAAIGPLPRQHGILAAMLERPRARRLGDIRREPDFGGWPTAHPALKDFLGVPIRDGDDTLGIIFLANKRTPGGFGADDEELLTLFAAHAALALTNARLHERARELTSVEERNRLARELHDAVAQKLFSLRLTAQTAATLAPRDPERTVAELGRVERLAGEALAELRAVIAELRPAGLADEGLLASLRGHIEVMNRVHDAEITLTAGPSVALTGGREAVVLRVAQEALHNAVRHARATVIAVRLWTPGADVVLEVSDDGRGFDVAAPGRHDGMGLASMRDRAVSVGGRLTIGSKARRGTRVRLEVPR
jgi:signal transduction histidine kinase